MQGRRSASLWLPSSEGPQFSCDLVVVDSKSSMGSQGSAHRQLQFMAGSVSSAARQVADFRPSPCVSWCQLSGATLTLRDRPGIVIDSPSPIDGLRLQAEGHRRLLRGMPVLGCEFQRLYTAPQVAQRHSAPIPMAQGCLGTLDYTHSDCRETCLLRGPGDVPDSPDGLVPYSPPAEAARASIAGRAHGEIQSCGTAG